MAVSPQRVLVFEQDASFVRELQEGFGRVGGEVEVVRDADSAIAQARSGDVALVLLSVDAMDTPGEAFLVCKRFKSDDDLAKIPFVILGGAQHAESFESHKKLKKRRADEYVEQPVSFHDLLAQVGPLAGFPSAEAGASADAGETNVVDDDIDAFADNAFGELIREEGAQRAASAAPVSVRAPDGALPPYAQHDPAAQHEPDYAQAGNGLDLAELEELRREVEQADSRVREAEQRAESVESRLSDVQARLEGAESQAQQAEAQARQAESQARQAESQSIQSEAHAKQAETRGAEAERRAVESEQRAREIEQRLHEAQARAETAEKRAAAAPTTQTGQVSGMSSRDYLDLREQLNRKDKELLALRDEVTQRDRHLLDASDRSLQLERTQAELHDNLAASQRSLEDAQTKIRAYEVDREAVSKRLEDFRGRLTRSEDKAKRVEDELELLKVSSAQELSNLEAESAQASEASERAAAAELQNARNAHAAALADLEARAQKELADANSARESALATLRHSQDRELADLRSTHELTLEELRRAAEVALAAALSEAANERDRALETLSNERAQELERRLGDAERAKAAALAGLERELEAKYTGERKELEERHASAIAALQTQLSDSQTHADVLSDRITEIEAAKSELDTKLSTRIGVLEGDLARRTQERDTAQNELSAMRASIASLERSGAQLSERLSALEVDLGRANDRIDQQSAKIALDKELLDRVRRALGIGIGLLEQQKQNVV